MSTKSPFFPGFTIRWDSPNAPEGWLLRDGRAISRQKYKDLFSVLGTRFGYGNGKTTFNLPDDRNVFPRGASELPSGNGSDKFYLGPLDSVDTGTDIFTVMNHGLNRTGLRIVIGGSPSITSGLSSSSAWVIILDEHRFRLADTEADALAGTYVDITAAGSSIYFFSYTEPLNSSASARLQSAPGGEILASRLGSRQHHGFKSHAHEVYIGSGGGGGYLTAGGVASVTMNSGTPRGSTDDVPPYYTGIQAETRAININTYWIIKT